MLVEPNPEAFKNLTERRRKAWLLPQCFSTKTTPEVVEFDLAGLIGKKRDFHMRKNLGSRNSFLDVVVV